MGLQQLVLQVDNELCETDLMFRITKVPVTGVSCITNLTMFSD